MYDRSTVKNVEWQSCGMLIKEKIKIETIKSNLILKIVNLENLHNY